MPPTIPHREAGQPDFSSPARYLYWLTSRQRARIVHGGVLSTLWMLALVLPPYLIARAIDDGLRRHDYRVLVLWTGMIAAAGIANAVLAILRHRTMSFIRDDASYRTVEVLSRQVSRLGDALRRQTAVGEVVNAGAADVANVSMALTVTGPGVGSIIAYAVVAVLLWQVSPVLALLILLGVPALAVVVGPLLRRLKDVETTYRDEQGRLTSQATDVVAGLRILAGVGGRNLFSERYRRRSGRLLREGYRVGAITSWVQAVAAGLPAVFLAVLVWISARMAVRGDITPGEMVAVYAYVALLVVPVNYFIEGGYDLARGLVAARRVVQVLALRPDHEHPCDGPSAPAKWDRLYDPESGFVLRAGRVVGLAAENPSDGRLVADRLGGYAGSYVTWDGVPISGYCAEDVRRRILVADNDAYVFAGTLRDVVAAAYAPDEGRLRTAVRVASADDIVDGLPGRYEQPIADRARNLSGGQRQRLQLARAIVSGAEVLILVEPASAVDAHTESRIAERLVRERAGLTTVIISTSPILLGRADEVAFLRDGAVDDVGSHADLMTSNDRYAVLVDRTVPGPVPDGAVP